VVEVDGHDYHERTREQAEHDRSRDRLMTAQGTAVLRFTGSEVWRNSRACAEEVLVCACRLMNSSVSESN
jgi:very-short-patch-repair endonuclease